jgi:DNA-binding NarL/FixJ family response regulator
VHKEIQSRIKKVAQALNFVATIEKKILEGQGIDVLLERDDATIAVEICVSTPTSHELDNNVRKCLDAGYTSIFLLSPDENRLHTINKALRNQFPPETTARIRCMTPDEFVAYLDNLSPHSSKEMPERLDERSRRGYKIRSRFIKSTPGETQSREEEILEILAEAMQLPDETT